MRDPATLAGDNDLTYLLGTAGWGMHDALALQSVNGGLRAGQ